jgi:biopolymer transport protein ExbB
MLDFLRTLTMGGPVMVPLGVCSLISIAVIIERACFYRRASADTQALTQQVRAAVERGDLAYAASLCERTSGAVAAVMATGLRGAWQGRDVTRAMEEQALAELPQINRRLSVLDTVITLAPLLGLLGTVTGMIRSFHIVSRVGMSHPTGITAGIAEALIATATGLVIAIYSLVAYNYFLDRVKHLVSEMEVRATQLANTLAERRGTVAQAARDLSDAEKLAAIVS